MAPMTFAKWWQTLGTKNPKTEKPSKPGFLTWHSTDCFFIWRDPSKNGGLMYFPIWTDTLPKTNKTLESWWLKCYFPFGMTFSRCELLVPGRVVKFHFYKSRLGSNLTSNLLVARFWCLQIPFSHFFRGGIFCIPTVGRKKHIFLTWAVWTNFWKS